MGFNTAVLVLNDAMSDIASDHAFGAKLVGAIQSGRRAPSVSARGNGSFINAATVISTSHADYYQTCIFGRNSGWVVSSDPDDGVPEEAIKHLETILKLRRRAKTQKQ